VREFFEGLTVALLVIEAGVAVVLAFLNFREVRFLDTTRPLIPNIREIPLYDALAFRARYITFAAVWLITQTLLGAIGVMVADFFPPIRAVNGAILLGLLAGPRMVGDALRRKAPRAGAGELDGGATS
jgi:hypothetical protein